MAQVQIPDFVGQNEERARGYQNAMLNKSRLKSTGIEQGEQQRAISKRNELEQLMLRTPEPDRDRAAFEWSKVNDMNLHGKLQALQLEKLQQGMAVNPEQAASAFERATGEKLQYDPQQGVHIIDMQDGSKLAIGRGGRMEHFKSDTPKPMLVGPGTSAIMPGQTEPFYTAPFAPKAEKQIERTVDLGNEVEYIYTDGTREKKAKGASPNTVFRVENKSDKPTPYQSKRLEVDLRKEFNTSPIVKEYDDVRKQMARVESAIEQAKTSGNFVAIDQALINGLNKMIDPGSVVREGEYARTIQNSPLLSRAMGKIDQIRTGGGGFTNEERTALVSMMRDFYKDAEGMYSTHATEYERLAEGSGMDKSRIVIKRDKIGPKAGSASSRIVQRNKTTGAYRHSDDGGKTWQPGQ